MDLEKKAEEYCLNKVTSEEAFYHAEFSDKIRQSYIDGYEQGIKDNDNYHLPSIEQKNEIINQLEKENEELKAQIENIEKENAILKDKCNCYLKNFNIDEDIIIGEQEEISRLQRLNTELTNTVSEKNLLIEKMKNCPNCELYDCTVNCVHTKCKYQYSEMCRDENMNDKWELSD